MKSTSGLPTANTYQNIKESLCDLAEPYAASMIESLRAFGYELPSSIADLIDNSIFAGAKNIWVDFNWHGGDSTICVTDDGKGMSEVELMNAMRPGSRNPLESRDPKDLGRFGLGMKTASFSQCRKLTVRSKTVSTQQTTRCWDLDFVAQKNKWLLLRDAGQQSEKNFKRLEDLKQGTVILWEKMDRIVKAQDIDDETHKTAFLNRISAAEDHLAMIFHRFMERKGGLKIFINNNPIEPWDPFLKSEPATQQIGDEKIVLFQKHISVIPYVLPHVSKIDPGKHERASGPKGWNLQQGFYVYRNERLLVPGDWLGLPFAKEEHFKLARIQLDIPNSMDHEWDIDVTKSRAHPPDALKRDLKHIADLTRKRACEVYRFRGKIQARQSSQDFVFVWQQIIKRGKYFYRVNREHPLVIGALRTNRKMIEPLLRMVEETVPVSQLTLTNSEHPDKHAAPFENAHVKEVADILEKVYEAMKESGVSHRIAIDRLRVMEPFDRFPELVETFIERCNLKKS